MKSREADFFYLGRPFWKATQYDHRFTYSVLLEQAVAKLKGPEGNNLYWMSVIFNLISFDSDIDHTSRDFLVKHSLAVLKKVEKDLKRISICFNPETIVSLAAAKIFQEEKTKICTELITNLSNSIHPTDVGNCGEIVGQLYLMDIAYSLMQENQSASFPFEAFMKKLLGRHSQVLFPRKESDLPSNRSSPRLRPKSPAPFHGCEESYLMSLVRICQFNKEMSYRGAKRSLCRGLGFKPISNNAGFDVALPMIDSSGCIYPLLVEFKNTDSISEPEFIDKVKLSHRNLVKKNWPHLKFVFVLINFRQGQKAEIRGNYIKHLRIDLAEFGSPGFIADCFHIDFFYSADPSNDAFKLDDSYLKILNPRAFEEFNFHPETLKLIDSDIDALREKHIYRDDVESGSDLDDVPEYGHQIDQHLIIQQEEINQKALFIELHLMKLQTRDKF